MARLDGKVALVTGAAGGLGRAIVERFLDEGASVAGFDLDAPDITHDRFLGVACDLTDDRTLQSAIDAAAERFGGLDVVINNAGVTGPFEGVDAVEAEAFDHAFAVLLRAPVMTTRHAAPHLKARGGGSVVNMTSAGGLTAGSTRFTYATAKAALAHYTREAAIQLAADHIRVNAIAPGLIPTEHVVRASGQSLAAIAAAAPSTQPLNLAATPDDIAEACVWLASDASRFVTGVILPVDGGSSAGRWSSKAR